MLGSPDGRIPPIAAGKDPVDIQTAAVTIKNVDAQALGELTTIQFFVRATVSR
jgi:hypothetical protein